MNPVNPQTPEEDILDYCDGCKDHRDRWQKYLDNLKGRFGDIKVESKMRFHVGSPTFEITLNLSLDGIMISRRTHLYFGNIPLEQMINRFSLHIQRHLGAIIECENNILKLK